MQLVCIAKGSPSGERAAKKAAEIAKKDGYNKISLLFIVDVDFLSKSLTGYTKEENRAKEGLVHIGKTIMEKLKKIILDISPQVNIKRILREGSTAEVIRCFVKNNTIAKLVIPKEERGPIEKTLVGGDIESFIEELSNYTKIIIVA